MKFLKQWFSAIIVLILIFLMIPAGGVSAGNSEQNEQAEALESAMDYLQTQQKEDGGIAGLSDVSDVGTSARGIMALKLNQIDPTSLISESGSSLVDYLTKAYPGYVYDSESRLFPANAGLILAAFAMVDQVPEELIQEVTDSLQEDGSFASEASSDWVSGAASDLNQSLVILGLSLSGADVPIKAVNYLIERQLSDGAWDNGFGPDLDTTAIAVISLMVSGQVESQHNAIQSALTYFRNNQQTNAGWKPDWDTDEMNVDTTGWITQALLTAGEDLSNWEKDGISPQNALLAQQKEDGSIGGTTYVNAYSTIEALIGLASQSFLEVRPVSEAISLPEANENQAGLVIGMPDGSTLLRCVSFNEETISGFDLLQQSGLSLETINNPTLGPGVCGIETQGCPSDDCFCGSPDYWSYWHWQDDYWAYAQSGSGTYQVQPNALEGWSWGDTPPIETSLSEICGDNPKVYIPSISNEVQEDEQLSEIPGIGPTENASIIDTENIKKDLLTQTTNYLLFAGFILGLFVIVLFVANKRKS